MEDSPAGSRPGLSPQVEAACVALLTLVGAALRLVGLDATGLTLDEGFSAHLARVNFAEFAATLWRSELNMAPYYALLRVWTLFGHSEFTLRLLSVLFAAATLPALYLLARRLFPGAGTALIAALLLAVHPFDFMLSREARSYSLVILLVTLASWCLLRMLDQPSWGIAAAYALISALAVYSHFFALLVVFGHAVALAWYPRRLPWRRLVVSAVCLAGLLAPLAVFLKRHGGGSNVAWIAPLQVTQVSSLLSALTLSKWRSLAYIVAWLVSLTAGIKLSRQRAWPYRFVTAWLLVPVLVTLGVSVWRPLLVERFLAVCIPAGVLLASAGIVLIGQRSRVAALALVAAMIFYSVSSIRHYYRHPGYDERWREATNYLLSQAHPGDEVVMTRYVKLTFDYYREARGESVPPLQIAEDGAPLPAPPPQNVWFIGSAALEPHFADEADAFARVHHQEYCAEPSLPETGSARLWRFRRCGAAEGGRR